MNEQKENHSANIQVISNNDDNGKMSEFGIKEIERMAIGFAKDYKFYKGLSFILAGLVVFSCSMIYLIFTVPNLASWIGVTGWILFSITVMIDLIVANSQVATVEMKLRVLGYNNNNNNKNENDNN